MACGPEAEALASALHSARVVAPHDRLLLRCQRKADIDAMLLADAEIDRMCEDIQLLVRAILIASGFHTHKGQLRQDLSLNSESGESALLAARSGSPESDWSLHFQEDSAIE
jgi:hypothetical protein